MDFYFFREEWVEMLFKDYLYNVFWVFPFCLAAFAGALVLSITKKSFSGKQLDFRCELKRIVATQMKADQFETLERSEQISKLRKLECNFDPKSL
jgi:hypothetical protein